jgi:hypothetical protein
MRTGDLVEFRDIMIKQVAVQPMKHWPDLGQLFA